MKGPPFGAYLRLRKRASQRTPSSNDQVRTPSSTGRKTGHFYVALTRTPSSQRALTEAAIILSFGSPSSPTEGLKISIFPGKRHQIRHLGFCTPWLLTEGLLVRI